jgi:hypothetical protein
VGQFLPLRVHVAAARLLKLSLRKYEQGGLPL